MLAARRLRAARPEEAARTAGDEAAKATSPRAIEALKRWCAAHLHDPALRAWVSFRFPETLDYEHLVHVLRPDPALPEAMVGPEEQLPPPRRLRAHRPAHRDARGAERDPLLRLCHERDKDSCSQGLRATSRARSSTNPLGIPLAGCPLDEKISEMHCCASAATPSARWRIVIDRQPDVPGHRPPHLQRLHEGLHLPEAGAGQHPADRDRRPHRRAGAAVGLRDLRPADALEPAQRPRGRTRCRTTARTCWSSASARPATRWRTTS